MGSLKGIGMTEDEWKQQVLQNKMAFERENAEAKRKMDQERQNLRSILEKQIE